MELLMSTLSLKDIMSTSPVVKVIMASMKRRKRDRKYIELNNFHKSLSDVGHDFTFQQLVDGFKLIEDAGVGSLVVGRNGKKNRFAPGFSMRKVAKAALAGRDLSKVPKIGAAEEIKVDYDSLGIREAKKLKAEGKKIDLRHLNPGRPEGTKNKKGHKAGRPRKAKAVRTRKASRVNSKDLNKKQIAEIVATVLQQIQA
jgi:hypothetical protein